MDNGGLDISSWNIKGADTMVIYKGSKRLNLKTNARSTAQERRVGNAGRRLSKRLKRGASAVRYI